MVSAEGDEVLTNIKKPVGYPDDSIIECRLDSIPDGNKARLLGFIRRADKDTPNSSSAISNIVDEYLRRNTNGDERKDGEL